VSALMESRWYGKLKRKMTDHEPRHEGLTSRRNTHRSTILNIFFKTWKRHPPPSILNSGSWASAGVFITLFSSLSSLYKIHTFMKPSTTRKTAETVLPMMPPTREKPSKRFSTAAAVDATTMDVMITIVLWPREKNVPTVTGLCPDAISLLVIKSMAEMWSASKACRSPNVQDNTAVEMSFGCLLSTVPTTIHTRMLMVIRRVMIAIAGNGSRLSSGTR